MGACDPQDPALCRFVIAMNRFAMHRAACKKTQAGQIARLENASAPPAQKKH